MKTRTPEEQAVIDEYMSIKDAAIENRQSMLDYLRKVTKPGATDDQIIDETLAFAISNFTAVAIAFALDKVRNPPKKEVSTPAVEAIASPTELSVGQPVSWRGSKRGSFYMDGLIEEIDRQETPCLYGVRFSNGNFKWSLAHQVRAK